MKYLFVFAVLFMSFFTLSAQASKTETETEISKEADIVATQEPAEVPKNTSVVLENTLEACRDKLDNDDDGHVDCDDQDCEIYAICVETPQKTVPPTAVVKIIENERGAMCIDGIDNDNNGIVDCHEASCRRERKCQQKMYYIPEAPDKAPSLLVTLGLGLAFPNFRGSDISVHSRMYNTKIPFDPDMGVLMDFKVGYLPTHFIGFGLNIKGGGSYGSNRTDGKTISNNFDDAKYTAEKIWGHGGMFLRIQYPFKRFVPYLDIAAGYSFSVQRWDIFSSKEKWSTIEEWDNEQLDYPKEEITTTVGRFSFALEPGFDVFVRNRSIAIGMRAWLPVWATFKPSYDNIGLTVAVTFTPLWRAHRQLKPEYSNEASDSAPNAAYVEPN